MGPYSFSPQVQQLMNLEEGQKQKVWVAEAQYELFCLLFLWGEQRFMSLPTSWDKSEVNKRWQIWSVVFSFHFTYGSPYVRGLFKLYVRKDFWTSQKLFLKSTLFFNLSALFSPLSFLKHLNICLPLPFIRFFCCSPNPQLSPLTDFILPPVHVYSPWKWTIAVARAVPMDSGRRIYLAVGEQMNKTHGSKSTGRALVFQETWHSSKDKIGW